MEVIVLGCGGSLGVPVIACACNICRSESIYNKRTRSSIIIRSSKTILVDFAYEIRQQLVTAQIKNIDAAILTHDHSDQVSGIDDLRSFWWKNQSPIPFYTNAKTYETLMQRYKYMFHHHDNVGPFLMQNYVEYFDNIQLGDMTFNFFEQTHGKITSFGIRVGEFAYVNDVSDFPAKSLDYLDGTKIWLMDCLDYTSTAAHGGLDFVMKWRDVFKPEVIYLTNMGHKLDYHKLITELPLNVIPSYDGMKINV
jgi:phosphoribosyl 1,2-cyclic phosphate phosphodiesterase